MAHYQTITSDKNKDTALIMCIFGGWFGLHQYYVGNIGKGYTQTKTFEFTHSNGSQGSRTSMMWTQKGRLFLYEFLKSKGILPRMEEEQISIC